jgi:CheY-like chemotaxis protein
LIKTDRAISTLILMDVQMPMMDGLEATMRIREHEKKMGKMRVPIIALTAHPFPSDQQSCLAAGMDDYLYKPLDPDKLKNLINTGYHSRAGTEPFRPPPVSASVETSPPLINMNINFEGILIMKKVIATLALLGTCAVAPAMAAQVYNTSTTTTTETRTTTYRTIAHSNLMSVEERRALQTAIERHVKRLDLNNDRRLSQDEYVSFHSQNPGAGQTLNDATWSFKEADLNGSGFVSSQEIMDAQMKLRAEAAARALASSTTVLESTAPAAGGNVVYTEKRVIIQD